MTGNWTLLGWLTIDGVLGYLEKPPIGKGAHIKIMDEAGADTVYYTRSWGDNEEQSIAAFAQRGRTKTTRLGRLLGDAPYRVFFKVD